MAQRHRLTFGPFSLDPEDGRLWRDDDEIVLRPKSFAVLRYLLERPGRVVAKEDLLSGVWADTAVSDTVLKVCVREIRKALGEDSAAPQYIETVPRRGYRCIASVTETAPRQASETAPETFALVVGRDAELEKLTQWLAAAERGERKIVFVTGEPGIGKTTLVDLFLDRAAVPDRTRLARGQSLERYGEGEAYLPMLEALGRLCREPGGDRLTQLLRQYAPTWLVQMPALLEDADLEALQRKVHGSTHDRMLREITEAIEVFAEERTLVLVLEDLQWSDHSTLELVSYLAHRRERVRLMLIGTYRPAEVALRENPLQGIKQELLVHGQCEEIALKLLTAAEVEKYVTRRVSAASHAPDLARLVHRRTNGNALFMVNVVEFALGRSRDDGSGVEELEHSVPDTVRQLIEKQLAALSGPARPLLEVASVAGVEFCSAATAAAAKCPPEHVEQQCDVLAERRYLLRKLGAEEWPDGTVAGCYQFTHGLYQQVLYEQMGAAQRVRVHRLLGERKEAGYGPRAREIAGELALHFECGRDYERAVRYHQQAAENALRRRAPKEAAAHLARGLELLGTLPETPARGHAELALQATLGRALLPIHGPAAQDVRSAYARARELCQQVGDAPELCPVLFGLASSYHMQGEMRDARAACEQLLRAAQRTGDITAVQRAHLALGNVLFWTGEFIPARNYLEESAALTGTREDSSDLLYAFDGHVRSLSSLSMALGPLGYLDQAVQRATEAVELASRMGSPFDLASARTFAAVVHRYRRNAAGVLAETDAGMTIAKDQDYPLFLAVGTFLHAWAQTERGELEVGIRAMKDAMRTWEASGAVTMRSYFLILLAEAYTCAGRLDEGLAVITEALADIEARDERAWEAEVHRLKGELLLQQENFGKPTGRSRPAGRGHRKQAEAPADAEVCFRQALDTACRQGAKLWELRAAVSLGRLWHTQGRQDDARRLLAEIYGWFTEGCDTPDLQAAKRLLAELDAPGT